MKKYLINTFSLSIFCAALVSCNSGSAGSSDSTTNVQATPVSINSSSSLTSSNFSVPIQVSPSQINPLGGSNNFCYTISIDNKLYYFYAACSPDVINTSKFTTLDLTAFMQNPKDLPRNSAADNNGNIYIGFKSNNSGLHYLVKCNVTNNSCSNMNLPFYPNFNWQHELCNDNSGNIYILSIGDVGIESYIYMSSDQGATWNSLMLNLNNLSSVQMVGILYNAAANQLVASVEYQNLYGSQQELMSYTPGASGWINYDNSNYYSELVGAQAFSTTGYFYNGTSYYENGVRSFFTLMGVTTTAPLYQITFDQDNNIYLTYGDGSTYWAKAPI